jgi:NADPH:quinone reductase-like Zn-dependent oxidoreductase
MKAAVLHEIGGVPVFEELDEPKAPEGQELAEVLVAGINPVDISMAAGSPTIPSVVGREGIARLSDGQRVYFDTAGTPFGSMASRVPVDPGRTFPVPEGLDDGLAVALGIAGLAGWLALQLRARVQAGETVLVLGATGMVGQIAAQAAKLLGASRVVAAARDRETLDGLRGADETVVLEGDYAAELQEAGGDGYNVVIDTIFGAPLEAALQATAPGARVVSLGGAAGPTISLPLGRIFDRTLTGHANAMTPIEDKRAAYAQMTAYAAAGELVVDVERAPLERVSEVWRRQASASPHRKLVLVP